MFVPVASAEAASGVTVVFRYDDFSNKTDTALERSIFELFERHGLSLTVGVIPAVVEGAFEDPSPQRLLPLSSEKVEVLRASSSRGTLDPALHGLSHQTHRQANGSLTEFGGLDYATQIEKLRRAKRLLEAAIGSSVRIFVPPWETYDPDTLDALEAVGMDTISAQGWGTRGARTRLKFVPSTSRLLDARAAVRSALESGDREPVVVVLFHAFDFEETRPLRGETSLADLDDLLAWVARQGDVRVTTISEAAQGDADLGSARAIGYHRLRWPQQLLPALEIQPRYLPDVESLDRLIMKAWILVLAFYFAVSGASLLTASAVGSSMFARWPQSRRPVPWVASLLTSLVAFTVLRDGNLGMKGGLPLAVLFGGMAALWMARGRSKPSISS